MLGMGRDSTLLYASWALLVKSTTSHPLSSEQDHRTSRSRTASRASCPQHLRHQLVVRAGQALCPTQWHELAGVRCLHPGRERHEALACAASSEGLRLARGASRQKGEWVGDARRDDRQGLDGRELGERRLTAETIDRKSVVSAVIG